MTKDFLKTNKKISLINNRQFYKCIYDKQSDNLKEQKSRKINKNNNLILKVSVINIVMNIILACIKIFAGFFGNSMALITDGFHSFSDIIVNVIVIIGVKVSSKKADKKFQYGYDRLENVAGVILSFILLMVGIFIAINDFSRLGKLGNEIKTPNRLALIISLVAFIFKFSMFIISYVVAKNTKSSILKADAFHHLTDCFSSIGIFIGVLSSMLGIGFMDILASSVICLLIFKVAIEIFIDAIKKMIDLSAPEKFIDKIKEFAESKNYVYKVCDIKTRYFGSLIYIDLDVMVCKTSNLFEANLISEKLEKEIVLNFESVKDCRVKTLPYGD